MLCIAFVVVAVSAVGQNMPERSLVRKGNRQFDKGNYKQSVERYTKALEVAPQSFEAAYNLSNALYKTEQFDKAEQLAKGAAADSLRADVERAEAFYNLGNAQFKQKKYKEALESYKQSLRMNPSDKEAKFNYAYTKRLLDQNKDDQKKDQNKDKNKDKDQQKQDQDKDQQKQDQNKDQDKDQKQDQNKDKNEQQQPQ
ncbi:MAG: tetratricopeptide repeat protein, partial [Alistipes sp.]